MPYVKFSVAANMPSGEAARADLDAADFPSLTTTAGRDAIRDALNRQIERLTDEGGAVAWALVERQFEETQTTGETVTRTVQIMSPVDGEFAALFDVLGEVVA